ncbi:MAG: GNAT family N-acetyltransferase [Myxococcaceae bacterium]|nr:GNAT family N-acetyltransferase [Myxococcaceae bacterium]
MVTLDAIDVALAPLCRQDVVQAYSGLGSQFDFVDDSRTVIDFEPLQPDATWLVKLFDRSGRCISGADGRPGIRRYLRVRSSLRGQTGLGRVAFNHMMCLEKEFRRKGLAREIYRREEALFRKWQAAEVHLNAGCDAVRSQVWQKLGFELSMGYRSKVEDLWDEYQRENGIAPGRPLERGWFDMDETFRTVTVLPAFSDFHLFKAL